MAQNKVSSWLRLITVGILCTLFIRGISGIVVRLGDSGASYHPSRLRDFEVGRVRVLPPRILSASTAPPPLRWKYTSLPSISLPLAYVVRQLPFLTTRSRTNTQPLSQPLSSPPLSHPSLLSSPTQEPATTSNIRGGSWAENFPLPFYAPSQPLTLSRDNLDVSERLAGSNLQHHQEVQTAYPPPAHYESEIIRLTSPRAKQVVMVTKEKNVAGRAGIDYPTYGDIPQTSFSCKEQRYKGFFGDPETECQAWHYCDFNGGQASFLCPNGTIFSQVLLTCDWWFNVKCNSTPQQYVINERLYKYIIPMAPSFPEDFQGPEVNQYLAVKFIELMQKEQKKLKEKLKEKEKEKNKKPVDVNGIGSNLEDDGLFIPNQPLQALTDDLPIRERSELTENKLRVVS